MSEKPNKKELENKIRELEKKLGKISDKKRADFVIATSPIGHDEMDTMRDVLDAKSKSEQKAGLIRLSDDGSVWEEDEPTDIKIPKQSIHHFDNLEFCDCVCHGHGKKDCMHCYDHPKHLEAKREMKKPPPEPTEQEVKPTKSRLRRLLDW